MTSYPTFEVIQPDRILETNGFILMTISIVTGGAELIGSHIVEKLKKLEHMVVVVDNEYSDNDNFHWRKDTLNVNRYHRLQST